jgi:hypothetical protein
MVTLADSTTEDEQTELASGRSRERDAQQQKVDSDMAALKAGWEAQGKPAPNASPAKRYTVVKAERAAAKDLIRKAGRFCKVLPVFYRDKVHENGTVDIKFTVAALPAKAEGNGETAPAPAPEPTPEPTPEPQSEGRRGVLGRR